MHQLISHYAPATDPKTHPADQQMHQEIARQIDRHNFIKAYEGLIASHTVSIDKLKKQLGQEGLGSRKAGSERGDCDTSI